MQIHPWDPSTVDRVTALLEPVSPVGAGHRVRPRLLAGDLLRSVTEVVDDAAGQPIGVVHISLDPTFGGAVGATVAVAPDHRGRGIGRAMADRADVLLAEHDADRRPLVVLREENERGQRLAAAHGFTVSTRSVGWTAALDDATSARHAEALEAVTRQGGVTIEQGSWATHGQAVLDLTPRVTQGLPRVTGGDDDIDPSLIEQYFFGPDSLFLVGSVDGSPMGFAAVSPVPGTTDWYIEFTGVDPVARGRGLARAFKHAEFVVAARAGATNLITFNEEHNAPVLALNASVGMQSRPGYVGMMR